MTTATTPLSLSLNLPTLQLGGAYGWVDVTDAECLLLKALAHSAEQRLDTAGMLECVGKPADHGGKHALEVQIVRLRKKLAQAGAKGPTIKVIRKFGYQLCVPLAINSSFPGQS
ncbi:MAG: helix-turn-helix domain-containing protein [Betaproteobacteria bacterium]